MLARMKQDMGSTPKVSEEPCSEAPRDDTVLLQAEAPAAPGHARKSSRGADMTPRSSASNVGRKSLVSCGPRPLLSRQRLPNTAAPFQVAHACDSLVGAWTALHTALPMVWAPGSQRGMLILLRLPLLLSWCMPEGVARQHGCRAEGQRQRCSVVEPGCEWGLCSLCLCWAWHLTWSVSSSGRSCLVSQQRQTTCSS